MVTLNCRKLISVALSALMIFQNLPLTPAYAALATNDKSAALIPATNNASSTQAVVTQKNSQPTAGLVVSANPSPSPVMANEQKDPDGTITTFDSQGRPTKIYKPNLGVYYLDWPTQETRFVKKGDNAVVTYTWAECTIQTGNTPSDGKISIVSYAGNNAFYLPTVNTVKGYLKVVVKNPDGTIQVQHYDNQKRLVKVKDPYAGTYTFDWKNLTATLTSKDGLIVSTWTNIYDSTKPHLPELNLTSVTIILGIKGKKATTKITTTAGTYLIDWQLKTTTLTSKDDLKVTTWTDITTAVNIRDDGRDPIGVLRLRGFLFTVAEYDPISGALKKIAIYENRKIKLVTLYQGSKKHEVKERTFAYMPDGRTIDSTTIFGYTPTMDVLVDSITYQGQIVGVPASNALKLYAMTYMSTEQPDWIFTFDPSGTKINTARTLLYHHSMPGLPPDPLNGALDHDQIYNVANNTADYKQVILGSPISETYYKGLKGSEQKFKMIEYNVFDPGVIVKGTLTWTTFFHYTNNVLDSSITYRGEILASTPGTAPKVLETKYLGNEGEELPILVWRYNFPGTIIKSTTKFNYAIDGTLLVSTVYRGQVNPGTEATAVKVSETRYAGPKGMELPERIFNYDFAGTAINSTTLFLYSGNVLVQSTAYRGMITGIPPATAVRLSISNYDPITGALSKVTDYNDTGIIKSVTFFQGPKGFEKKFKMIEYNVFDPGVIVKGTLTWTTFFHYTNNVLDSSITYRGEILTGTPGTAPKVLETKFLGNEGEEVPTLIWRYNFPGTTIKTSMVLMRNADGSLGDSILYRGVVAFPIPSTIINARISQTFYQGPKGSELPVKEYTYNFAGDRIDTTTFYHYAGNVLIQKVVYQGQVDSPATTSVKLSVLDYDLATGALTKKTNFNANESVKSIAFFQGVKGSEKVLLVQNYNFAGTVIQTSTVNTYVNDTLSMATTYRGEVTLQAALTPIAITSTKSSITTFAGMEGEELPLRIFSFNVVGTNIDTVQVNEYALDVLVKSTLYRVLNFTTNPDQVVLGEIISVSTYGNEQPVRGVINY